MFKHYPQTYRINVYQGRREFAYPQEVCERAKWNAQHAEIVDDGLGYSGLGFIPFPIPQNAMEVLWNHQLPFREWTQDEIRDIATVAGNGSIGWGRARGRCLSPSNDLTPGVRSSTSDAISAYCITETLLPQTERGISRWPTSLTTIAWAPVRPGPITPAPAVCVWRPASVTTSR